MKSNSQSFLSDNLTFSNLFHSSQVNNKWKPLLEIQKKTIYGRFQKSMQRKILHAKRKIINGQDKRVKITSDQHQYDYKQFGNQPKIDFSPISLLIITPILLCVNLSIVKRQNIAPAHFVFLSMFVAFVFNLIFIIRKNRIMPFLPTKDADDKLKITSIVLVISVFFILKYGWSASGGMIFAVIWQSIAGKQGCFFLIIFGAIIGGTITMELTSPQTYLMKLISSILFGVTSSLIKSLQSYNVYSIANQLSLFLMIGGAVFYIFMPVHEITLWQHFIMIFLGFSVYFNLLMIVKLMQSQRVSTAMGVISGIIIISATDFTGSSNYVASLTIILSILVLIKIQYIDKNKIQ